MATGVSASKLQPSAMWTGGGTVSAWRTVWLKSARRSYAYVERVDFGHVIGMFVDDYGRASATTMGTIHHSKTGVHIVPARPRP